MKKKITVVWIDDDPIRRAESDNIESRLKLDIKFIDQTFYKRFLLWKLKLFVK